MFNLFNRNSTQEDKSVTYSINYSGNKGIYKNSFSNMGIICEDNGSSGFLYATNKEHTEIYDTLQLYNYNSPEQPKIGEKIYIVVNEPLQKVGIYYQEKFHAVFDFKNERGSNLLDSPVTLSEKWKNPHKWDKKMIKGLKVNYNL